MCIYIYIERERERTCACVCVCLCVCVCACVVRARGDVDRINGATQSYLCRIETFALLSQFGQSIRSSSEPLQGDNLGGVAVDSVHLQRQIMQTHMHSTQSRDQNCTRYTLVDLHTRKHDHTPALLHCFYPNVLQTPLSRRASTLERQMNDRSSICWSGRGALPEAVAQAWRTSIPEGNSARSGSIAFAALLPLRVSVCSVHILQIRHTARASPCACQFAAFIFCKYDIPHAQARRFTL